ncbi:MAG TPA: RNA 2',3'-cyclic phosphodiesterase [Candidatus Dormibacteraeota bacterium]|nr:RNA 2',3'-cyclic phosphodiesterase [Candidatus Dormibacteraeota bacterium]
MSDGAFRGRSGGRGRAGDRWAAPVDEPGTVRLFFAVPVPAEAREHVGELMRRVQASVGDGTARIRWVRVDGLHLTLRFLGPTPEDRRAPLEAGADALASADAPFEVVLDGGGAFPSLAQPRSLWVGIGAGADRLGRLADGLTAAAGECGLVLDTRPFAPHLTIARIDGVRLGPSAAQALAEAATGLDVRFTVDRVVLFRSILGGGPARYEPLHEAILGATIGAS